MTYKPSFDPTFILAILGGFVFLVFAGVLVKGLHGFFSTLF